MTSLKMCVHIFGTLCIRNLRSERQDSAENGLINTIVLQL
jgi:hypothetical protein